jgi:hypothetical protein
MVGFRPAIHDFLAAPMLVKKSWMLGTSPSMTMWKRAIASFDAPLGVG